MIDVARGGQSGQRSCVVSPTACVLFALIATACETPPSERSAPDDAAGDAYEVDVALDSTSSTDTSPEGPVGKTAAPRFSPWPDDSAGCARPVPPGGLFVSMTSTTPAATLHYTTDGTTPSTASTTYTAPLHVTTDTTFKAMALAPGLEPSDVAVGVYRVSVPAETVQAVTFDPPGGVFATDVVVELRTASATAWICYTTDGAKPACGTPPIAPKSCDAASTLYSAPVSLKLAASVILRAIACQTACVLPSAITSATYTKG